MRIGVCEDNLSDAHALSELLLGYGEKHSFSSFPSPDALLNVWSEGKRFDCYILDIMLGKGNGIDLARELRSRGDRSPILFLTSSPDYALSAFSVHAAGYLLKPVERTALYEALDHTTELIALRQKQQPRHFTFRTPSGLQTTPIEDILYVEIMGHTPSFHLTSGTILGSTMRVSFEESVSPLIESSCFLRPHRSFLVNAGHIVSVTPKSILLDNGTTIPISRTRAAEVRARYLDFLSEESRFQ